MSELQNSTQRHRIKCLNCMTIIESLYGHHFVSCNCGSCSVDGGPNFGEGRILYGNAEKIELLPTDDTEENQKVTEEMRKNVKEHINL